MKKTRLSLIFSLLILFTASVSAQDKLYPNTFPLQDVKLLDGPFKHACELNTEVLLSYNTDRLLAPFLKEAGLTPKGSSFSNWIDLDGHIGGHYLSALAIHYAATGNQACKERMEYMISELKRCQAAQTAAGNVGYVGGVPNGIANIWNRVKGGTPTAVASGWVPWYNLHKTYAGLRDAWLYGDNQDARQMFLDLCDWGLTIIAPLSDTQMESMLATEFGGMNEVYADAYQMTGEAKYLTAAKRFAHKTLFSEMSTRVDNLSNLHANTQVPKAVGYQRVAELCGEASYVTAAGFFWETVVNNRSLSFGGNSREEHFPEANACGEYVEVREGPETCNTNNMLKLTEGLFRMDPQAKYADYYERAMFNHILSSQHPEHGGYVYFTPARPRHYRVYSETNKAMWCCVGTGMENHGKYGEFIYSHTSDSLFLNLFVASELTWRDKNITIAQETDFPYEERTSLKVTSGTAAFSLLVRYPSWVAEGALTIKINGENYPVTETPASYIKINRSWKTGDVLTIETPMQITVEELPNVPNYISVLKGPIVLAARTGTEDLLGLKADEGRWAHIAAGALLPTTEAPFIVGDRAEIIQKLNAMEAVEGEPFHYKANNLFKGKADKELIFEPFYQIHDSRYMLYWLSMTEREYEMAREELEKAEYEKVALDNRTIDDVKPEQQPEVDHQASFENSKTGYHNGEAWRDANNGYISYNLLTGKREDLLLRVRYWGNEGGNRTFSILIDGELLTTENVTGKWNVNK
ncbi:glycoside hydrolase family 127 protein, partial [Bacteroidales bacterium OttesenSCG-928-L03]|nr:glycoside hydrolase family 127 protein [Bacteroidales bacterium OttesenSCG-928-L03]